MAFGFGFGLPMIGNPQWSPASLFYQSEPGAWYDPSDLSTLYQDQAGTTPVTAVEQSVGLMLDKSKGLVLGSELVTNGTFDTNITGWTALGNAALSWQSGSIRVQRTDASGYPVAAQTIALVSGKTYKLTCNYTNPSNLTVFLSFNGIDQNFGTAASGSIAYFLTATGSTTNVQVGIRLVSGSVGQYIDFDNISVKELPGNHAYTPSASATSRPVLSARYNLLTKTEQFVESGKYQPANITVTENAGTAPDGTNTAIKLAATASTTTTMFYEAALGQTAYRHVWYIKKGVLSGSFGNTLLFRNTTTSTNVASASINFDTGVISNVIGTAFSSENAGNNWWKITGTVTSGFAATDTVRLYYGWSSAAATAGDFIFVWHPDCRVPNEASSIPSYQRVNTSTDYDTVGFPLYLKADGVDDYMQTNSIDFTATDKMTVWAGVRKLSDAATGMVTELSSNVTTNNGSFYLTAPTGAGASNFQFASKGTTANTANPTGYAAPISAVLSMATSITPPSLAVKANGVALPISTSDQGTGNFGNYPLYLFRRGGSSLPFNGRFYGMTVLGAATNQIVQGETYLNQKMGLVY